MPEIPDKKENFETDYESLLPEGYSAVASGSSITGSHLLGGIGEDHISFDYNNYWDDTGFSLTGNPYASPDVLSLNSHTIPTSFEVKSQPNSDHFWKFGEGKTLKVVEEYIKGTYNGHYASDKSKVQVLDMIDAIDDGVPFCRDNLIKYIIKDANVFVISHKTDELIDKFDKIIRFEKIKGFSKIAP